MVSHYTVHVTKPFEGTKKIVVLNIANKSNTGKLYTLKEPVLIDTLIAEFYERLFITDIKI